MVKYEPFHSTVNDHYNLPMWNGVTFVHVHSIPMLYCPNIIDIHWQTRNVCSLPYCFIILSSQRKQKRHLIPSLLFMKCLLYSNIPIMQSIFIFFQDKLNCNLLFNVSMAYRLTSRIYLNKLEFNDKYEQNLCMTHFALKFK